MEFLKNHYEKVVLSIVLLGLAVVVAILPMKVPSGLGDADMTPAKGNKPTPLDVRTNELALQKLENFKPASLTGIHNLFNPVQWQRFKPNGPLVKITNENQFGPGAIKINKIYPLYFMLSYVGYNPPKFQISVVQEASKNPTMRGPFPTYAQLNEKTEYYTITEATPPDNPTDLTLLLNDGTTTTITKEKPYRAVSGYMVDLTYPPEQNRQWTQRREGDKLLFDQDTNNIVAISSNAVVLSSSSGKRTKIMYHAAP